MYVLYSLLDLKIEDLEDLSITATANEINQAFWKGKIKMPRIVIDIDKENKQPFLKFLFENYKYKTQKSFLMACIKYRNEILKLLEKIDL